jgi:hypothetical protein
MELRAIPVPPGLDTLGEPEVVAGQAATGFYGKAEVEEILAFYGASLRDSGWSEEMQPKEELYPDEGGGGQKREVHWSLTKDHLRILILIDQTPKDATPGEIAGQLILEPVWYPGFNTDGIPGPSAVATPIIILPDSTPD